MPKILVGLAIISGWYVILFATNISEVLGLMTIVIGIGVGVASGVMIGIGIIERD